MHIHILGICGTFMGGIAQLARALGHRVTGADANVYPPMSDQLATAGIAIHEGWDPGPLDPAPDCVIIGNALSRGNPSVEYVLERGLPYASGPQWLHDHLLRSRWVLAVAGTHGKTTTASLVAWLLEHAGLSPGFLIGGVPTNFGVSARLGDSPFFVVEADEYDTAFFDKRSKFVHYPARTAVLNNLEFDHADIFDNLEAIQRQFHHFVRIIPGNGLIIHPGRDENLQAVLKQGCWSESSTFGLLGEPAEWVGEALNPEVSRFRVHWRGGVLGEVAWSLCGTHNMRNALAAIAAANHAGVIPQALVSGLAEFRGVKRRQERVGEAGGVTVYDDFAHHPTAIRETLAGFMAADGAGRLIAVLEPRSNTMRLGSHAAQLPAALDAAHHVVLCSPPGLGWDPVSLLQPLGDRAEVTEDVDTTIERVCAIARPGDRVVVMSNGGFGGIHRRLLAELAKAQLAR